MERNLGGLKPIKRWLEDNWCENLYERMDYRIRFEAKSLVTECKNFAKIVSGIFGQEDTLMEILAKYHDVGKFAQYRLLGFEDDEKLSHNALGLDSLDRFIELNEIKITPEIQILRDVIYYHGRKISQKAKLSENSIKYVEQISIIEVFTMECIRDLANLERIAEKDVRRYNKEFPEYIGKVREEIYTFFRNEDFRERRFFLKSYAEEVLVSVMKAIRLMREYGSTLQKAMTVPNYYYVSALAGYSYLMNKYMPKEMVYDVERFLRKESYEAIKYKIVPDDAVFEGSGEKFLKEVFNFLRMKGVEKLPDVEKGKSVMLDSDDFWELRLMNLNGKNMCFSVKYFSESSEKSCNTTRFTLD